MPEWHEDEAFWIATYPFMFPDDQILRGEEQVEQILKLSGVTPATALDLGCGPGRHAVPLARRGVLYGDLDGRAYGLEATRLVALARVREA